MLKAYQVRTYVTVNNKNKYELFKNTIGLADDFEPMITKQSYNFAECVEYLTDNNISCLWVDKTLFLQRPYINIKDEWLNVHRYDRFDSITIERHYEPYEITMNELFKTFSADECIQYLKDRGMTTCPILK